MPAETLDLTIEQGATFEQFILVKRADETPYDLAGWIGRGQVRRSHRDSTVLIDFTVTITDAPTGEVRISLTAAQTTALPYRFSGVYDVELEQISTGKVIRVLQGRAIISPEVTR